MAGNLQPLDQKFPIVRSDGRPTEYFIRWAQQRQIDISGGITAEQANTLIIEYLAAHQLQAGSGINITPDGNISNDPTIAADVQVILDQITNVHGSILYRDSGAWVALAPGTSGQFLKTQGAGADPVWAAGGGAPWDFSPPLASAFTLFTGDATNVTLTDDADVGLIVSTTTPVTTSIVRGGYKALPAVGTDFSVTMKFDIVGANVNFIAGGLIAYESATGKAHTFLEFCDSASNLDLRRQTIAGVYTADVKVGRPWSWKAVWLRIARVGTNLIFSHSTDGKNWIAFQTIAQNTYLTTAPDRIGPGLWLNNSANLPIMSVQYWAQTGF